MTRIVCLDRQALLDGFLPPGQHDEDRMSRLAGITGRLPATRPVSQGHTTQDPDQ